MKSATLLEKMARSLTGPFHKWADSNNRASWSNQLRLERAERYLLPLINSLGGTRSNPARILDCGGTTNFWEFLGLDTSDTLEITVLNLYEWGMPPAHPHIRRVKGDCCDLREFKDKEFHLCLSNSVIEHVGDASRRLAMANEMRRVGQKVYCQTPNRWFLIEPHFTCPGFHFLPVSMRAFLLAHASLGHCPRAKSYQDALETVKSIHLLDARELQSLFPEEKLSYETVYGLRKSLIVSTPIQQA